MFSSKTKSGPNSLFIPRPIFKIVDKAFVRINMDGSYEHQYQVLYSRDDSIKSSQWITEKELDKCKTAGGETLEALRAAFRVWYDSNRFGGAPYSGLGYIPSPSLNLSIEAYKNVNYGYILSPVNRFGRALWDVFYAIHGFGYPFFVTGFNTRIDNVFPSGIDKKLTEISFFRGVLKSWDKISYNTYTISTKIVGRNCYYVREARCVSVAADKIGLSAYKYVDTGVYNYYGSRNVPLIILFSSPHNYVPNSCSVVIIRWDERPIVWLPYQQGNTYGLKLFEVRNFAESFSNGVPLVYFDGRDTRHDSMLRCLQFIARLLDGVPLTYACQNQN